MAADSDDTFAEAVNLGLISTTARIRDDSISPDTDVDMYSFTVSAGQAVDIDADTSLNGPGGLGTFFRLFNSQGQVIASNDNAAAPGEASVGFDAYIRYTFTVSGTYYLGVSNANNTSYDPIGGESDRAGGLHATGDYRLIIQALPVDTDDAISEAISLGPVNTAGTTINNSISTDIDVDMFRFTVTNGQVVDFDIDTLTNGGTGLGSFIRLFNASGQVLASNDDGTAPGENTLGYDAYLRFTFTTAGTYYLGVSNYNNVSYDPNTGNNDIAGGQFSIGDYSLTLKALPVDPDDAISEATSLGQISTTPITTDAVIDPDIDVDVYQFTVSANQVVDFDIDTVANGVNGLGSYLRLFNSSGLQLASNDNATAPGESTLGFDAYLRFTFTTSGTYYIAVSNATNVNYSISTGNNDTAGGQYSIGNYQLIVSTPSAAPPDADDQLSEATPLGNVTTIPLTTTGTIASDVDVDMVRFAVTANQTVDFDIDTTLNGTGGLGSFIRLFDLQGQQLASNDDANAPGENVIGFDSYLRYTFTTSGTYYLAISNNTNRLFDPVTGTGDTSGGQNATGDYSLSIVALPVDTDDTLSEAAALSSFTSAPVTIVSTLSPDIDVDMYRFTINTTTTVDIDIDTTLNGPGGLGSYLRIFNSQGQQLAFNDNATAPGENVLGFDAYLRFTFPSAGTYYIGVSNATNTSYDAVTGNNDVAGGFHSIGDYSLTVQIPAATPVDTDDQISEAIDMGVMTATPKILAGTISVESDVDMYRFTVGTQQLIDIDIDTTLNGTGGLGSYIRLFDSNGTQIAFNDDAIAPGETILGFDAYLRVLLAPGNYFLGVSNSNNKLYDAVTGNADTGTGANATGDYLLSIQVVVGDNSNTIGSSIALGAVSQTPITTNATISPDVDVDVFSFTVASGQTVDFDIDTTLNGTGGLGGYLRLFDITGQQLAFNDNAVAPGEVTLGFDPYLRYTFSLAGTYYVAISNANNTVYNPILGTGVVAGGANSVGDYTLTVQVPVANPADDDDAITEATPLGLISTTAVIRNGAMSVDTDVDMYSFSVTSGQVVDFDIDTTLNGAGGLGSYLRLFTSTGQQLAFNDDAIAPGENTVGFDAYLRYTFAAGGTYYVAVSANSNVNYDPLSGGNDISGGANAIGNYTLLIQGLPTDLDDSITEATFLGAVTGTAFTVDAVINPDIDVDMYRFTVVENQTVDFDIDTPINGPGGLGSYLRLFNSSGQQLTFSDNAAAPGENSVGFDAYIRYTFTTAGTYYLGVSNANNTTYDASSGNNDTAGGQYSIGDYRLIVQTGSGAGSDTDDTTTTAISLGVLSTTTLSTTGTVQVPTDVNLYRLTATSGQIIDIDVDTLLNGSTGLGSYIRLFNGNGQQIASNDNGTAPGENTLGLDAYLRFTISTTGTYYIGISNSNNIAYDPITGTGDVGTGSNAIGDYTLNVVALPVDPDDTILEATNTGAVSATPLVLNNSIDTDIDVDIYKFTVTNGQVVDFDIDTVINGPGGLNSYLRLFDGNGQQLSFNNDAAAPGENVAGIDAFMRHTFTFGGTYFIAVSNSNNFTFDPTSGGGDTAGGQNSIGSYQLTIQTAAAAPADADDTFTESSSLGAISTVGITVNGNIGPDTDVDMMRFTVTAGQTVDFDIDTTQNGPGGLGSYLRLFNSAGQQLAFNDNLAAPGETSEGFDAFLRYTFTTAGTYYIAVSNSTNIAYDPQTGDGDIAGGQNAIGDYQISVIALPNDADDALSEAPSLGAISSTPNLVNGTISPDVDVDMYRFTVTAGQIVDFDVDTPLNGLGGLGSYLRVFNSTGQQIAANDNAAAPGEVTIGFDSYIRFTFATAGTYYVGVSSSDNANYDAATGNGDATGGQYSIGDYQLTLVSASSSSVDDDDAIGEAISLGPITTVGVTSSNTISIDIDVDLYSFVATAGQTIDFDIDTPLNGGSGLGSYLRLFNAQGQQLALNNNAAAPGENSIGLDAYLRFTFATAGTYYVSVSNSNNTTFDINSGDGDLAGGTNTTGDYLLNVIALPVDLDDTIGESINLGAITATATTVNNTISPDIDVDMYRFTVVADQVVDFDIDTATSNGLGSLLRLFNSAGTQLASNDNGTAPGEPTLSLDAYLRYTFTNAGTYYIAVSNSNNSQFEAISGNSDTAGGPNSIGDYQLIVQTAPAEPDDLDDSIAEAVALGTISTTPVTVDAEITSNTDVDMFKFTAGSGKTFNFNINTALNGAGGLNSYLRLFNASGQELAFNDNGTAPGESVTGFDAFVQFTFTASGTYYIAVSNANNTGFDALTGGNDTGTGANGIGSYRLLVSEDSSSITPVLTLSSVLNSIPEAGGQTTVTISRTAPSITTALVVSLASSDINTFVVPTTITIPANATSVSFQLNAINSPTLGDRSAQVIASAASFQSDSLTIFVTNSVATPGGGQNPVQPNDTSNDGSVSAIDALLIINYLNTAIPGDPLPASPPYLDVNGDDFISALDALIVINALNGGAPEGESNTAASTAASQSNSTGSGVAIDELMAPGELSRKDKRLFAIDSFFEEW